MSEKISEQSARGEGINCFKERERKKQMEEVRKDSNKWKR
tara:strand:+ start:1163 stop:1282 length:120 start_codon:yes stop_codon:yes gene_type:complete